MPPQCLSIMDSEKNFYDPLEWMPLATYQDGPRTIRIGRWVIIDFARRGESWDQLSREIIDVSTIVNEMATLERHSRLAEVLAPNGMISKERRKELSYHGAIDMRHPSPLRPPKPHFTDPATGTGYRDPGNWVYGRAFDLLAEELPIAHVVQGADWTDVTKGDIFEAILALSWEKPADKADIEAILASICEPRGMPVEEVYAAWRDTIARVCIYVETLYARRDFDMSVSGVAWVRLCTQWRDGCIEQSTARKCGKKRQFLNGAKLAWARRGTDLAKKSPLIALIMTFVLPCVVG